MFSKPLQNLTLASYIADGVFPNIIGITFKEDQSLAATLRALLYDRIENDVFSSEYTRTNYTASAVRDASYETCINAFIGSGYGNNNITFHIHSFDNTEQENAASFDVIDHSFISYMPDGFVSADDLVLYLEQKSVKTRIFINQSMKKTIIFIDNMDLRKWHFIQSLIPRLFPWWFAENPLSEEEMALLKSLTNRYATNYESLIKKFSSKFNFRESKIRNALTGFETAYEKNKLSNVKDQIERLESNIQGLEQRFSDYYKALNDCRIEEAGLISKIAHGNTESEFMDYFICNHSLHLEECRGSKIKFIVATTLTNFDPDMFEAIIGNENSFFYRTYDMEEPYNTNLTDEEIKKLMTAIFGTEVLKLRVCAAYALDFGAGYYEAIMGYQFPAELSDYTPNQHIQHYGCLGNNAQEIRSAIRRYDYIGAVEACVSSAKNINLAENNTGTFFMQKILAKNAPKIIELPDGTNVTPQEAVKWLEEQEKGENHE